MRVEGGDLAWGDASGQYQTSLCYLHVPSFASLRNRQSSLSSLVVKRNGTGKRSELESA